MADAGGSFRAACVQMRSGLDRARNIADAISLIEDAASQGAVFVTTPEMTNVVNRSGKSLLADLPEESGLQEISAFGAVAKKRGIWLLIGSVAVGKAGRAANRSLLFDPHGNIVARYDKMHMFDVDLPNGESWKESNIYTPGDHAVVVDTDFAKLGLSICYDLRFPKLYRQMAQAGADLFCVPAAFTRQTGKAHWKTLLSARAIENGAFVVAAAQGGAHEDGRETFGHSLIVGPWGEILAEAEDDEPGVILADIEIARAREARMRIPNLTLEENFEITIIKQ